MLLSFLIVNNQRVRLKRFWRMPLNDRDMFESIFSNADGLQEMLRALALRPAEAVYFVVLITLNRSFKF